MTKKIWMICLLVVFLFSGCAGQGIASEMVSNEPEFSTETSSETSTAEVISEVVSEEVEESSEELIPEPETLSLIMVGDILLHDRVESAARQEDGNYDYTAIFQHTTDDIQSADIAIVNQEVILGGESLGVSGYPAFNAPFTVGDALVKAGFDVVCHGTNHALDKGRKGVLNSLTFWKEQYPEVAVLGIHDSQESQDNLYIYDQGAFKVAILNYTYGTNGIPLPDDMPYAVDLLEEAKVIADIQKAEELADFTILCPHWGTEYQLVQSKNQENWAKLFAEHGVDLVLGTHPHVIQPIEWVDDMLVYYSLGNFVNWTGESGKGIANRMVGGMAQVTLTLDAGKVSISEYGVEPVIAHLEQGINGVTVYKLSDYTEELAQKNQIRLQDEAFSKEYCELLCEQVFKDLYE